MINLEPAYEKKNIPVVFASSAYYAPYLAVTLKSLIDTSSNQFNYDIIVLHKEINIDTQLHIKNLKEEKKNVSIRFVEIDSAMSDINYNFRPGYSAESFYRVIMMNMLKYYDKTIYLDCDVIVKHDISELFTEYDISDYYVAAARDIDGIASSVCNHENRKEYMIEYIGLSKLQNYFQSGVMIFNLSKIREDFTIEQILQTACAQEIMYGDQDVLNKLFHEKVKYLDMAWNVIINHNRCQLETLLLLAPIDVVDEFFEAREGAKIIHFAGTKPWNVPDAEYAEEFWKVARDTYFYDEILNRELYKGEA